MDTTPLPLLAEGALLGLAVGDALGVPVEFTSREERRRDPVTGMRAGGTWGQEAGTWSDDSSLSFCLAEALCRPLFDPYDLGPLFLAWYREGYWTAHGRLFDIGETTEYALQRIAAGAEPVGAGPTDVNSNGNGALMRILPLAFALREETDPIIRYTLTRRVAAVTHGHMRSAIGCFLLLEYAAILIEGLPPDEAYRRFCREAPVLLQELELPSDETDHYHRVLSGRLPGLPEEDIASSGYVVDTLEAALWCLLTETNYRDAVLKAVNLGKDTDTTAAVCGGLAGLAWGAAAIPAEWLDALARREDIRALARRLGSHPIQCYLGHHDYRPPDWDDE